MDDTHVLGLALGRVINFGMSGSPKVPQDVWEALVLLKKPENVGCLDGFLEASDLQLLIDTKTNWFAIMPGSPNSPYRIRNEEIRSKLSTGAKQAFFAYALMGVIATFYPTRYALNTGQFNEIRLEDVYDTLDKMKDFAEAQRGFKNDDAVTNMMAISKEFSDLQKTENGKGTNPRFQEYYVLTALKALVEQRLIKEEKSSYLPRERFAFMISKRLGNENFAMPHLIALYHDHLEGQ